MKVLMLIFIIVSIYLFMKSRSTDQSLINTYKETFQLPFLAPLAIYLVQQLRVMDRLAMYILPIHHKIVSLYSFKEGKIYTMLFLAQIIGAMYVCLFVSTILAVLANDLTILGFGVFLTILIPPLLIKGLSKEIDKKHQKMLLELPELLNKIILLVNAGENVQQAIIKIVQRTKGSDQGILTKEFQQVAQELQNNISFRHALEEMSKRCAVQEISVFTTTILLNYRRGGNDLVVALRMLAKELWQKRKAVARTMGEQASSQLVFPMVLIFLVVLVIIATPAILLL